MRDFRDQFFVSLIASLIAFILMLVFLEYVETRNGIALDDPFLPVFSPTDLRWITFSLIYSGMLLGLVSLCLYPFSLLLALRTFVVMSLLRIACLYLLPLGPPPGMIPLADPFIQLPGVPQVFTRDLFFSWQIATLAILVFTAQWRDMRIIFSCVAVAVAVLLLLQHVHYTIDLVAAPCFAYVAYGFAKWLTIEEVAGLPERSDKPLPSKAERQSYSSGKMN